MFTTWINEAKSFVEMADAVEITAGENTNFFISATADFRVSNAPIYALKAGREFTLVCEMRPSLTKVYDAGALMLYINDENWVKFAFEYTDLGYPAVVSVVTNAVSDDANGEEIHTDSLWMKLTRKDQAIGLYYSFDSVTWKMARLFGHRIQKEDTVYVGLLAQSPLGEECKVVFQHIEYRKEAVKNFRKGINDVIV